MAGNEQPDVPIWAASKARKQIDILKEVAHTLAATEMERARRPLGELTESDLEAEQFRLEQQLQSGTLTVDNFRRLREIDFFLHEMRQRRASQAAHHEWKPESLSD